MSVSREKPVAERQLSHKDKCKLKFADFQEKKSLRQSMCVDDSKSHDGDTTRDRVGRLSARYSGDFPEIQSDLELGKAQHAPAGSKRAIKVTEKGPFYKNTMMMIILGLNVVLAGLCVYFYTKGSGSEQPSSKSRGGGFDDSDHGDSSDAGGVQHGGAQPMPDHSGNVQHDQQNIPPAGNRIDVANCPTLVVAGNNLFSGEYTRHDIKDKRMIDKNGKELSDAMWKQETDYECPNDKDAKWWYEHESRKYAIMYSKITIWKGQHSRWMLCEQNGLTRRHRGKLGCYTEPIFLHEGNADCCRYIKRTWSGDIHLSPI